MNTEKNQEAEPKTIEKEVERLDMKPAQPLPTPDPRDKFKKPPGTTRREWRSYLNRPCSCGSGKKTRNCCMFED